MRGRAAPRPPLPRHPQARSGFAGGHRSIRRRARAGRRAEDESRLYDNFYNEKLDIIAALCDPGAIPAGGATEPDVSAGDPRCGQYLR